MHKRLQAILLRVAMSEQIDGGDTAAAMALILDALGEGLRVERCGLWMFDADGGAIRCTQLRAAAGAADVEHEPVLDAARYPNYFRALAEGRDIAATDARSDPRTAEFGADYLQRHDIGALLDAPVRHHGRLIGILCAEHPASPRPWSVDEQVFAGNLADIAARAIAAESRLRSQQALQAINSDLQTELAQRKLAQHEQRAAAQRFQGLLARLPVAVGMVNAGGAIEFRNDRFIELFGHDPASVPTIDHWWQQAYPDPVYRQSVIERWNTAMLRAISAGSHIEPDEYNVTCADGTERVVEISGVLLGHDLLATFVDLTERKRVERMKTEFVSTVSHELRTPLTSINGALGLVASGALGVLPTRAAELLQVAQRNCQQLTVLINDLLDMDKLSAGQLSFELQPVALAPLLGECVESMRPFAARLQVSLQLGTIEAGTVLADPLRLQQVIGNLLSNACKFSRPGGEVRIEAHRIEGGPLRIEVIDQGAGVPEHFRDRIFDKFTQADASDGRRHGGTGLGLAICRALVEGMRGRIDFTSSSAGSCFFVDLPAAP